MASLTECREALADVFGTITGLRVYPFAPDGPSAPFVAILPDNGSAGAITYSQDDYLLRCRVAVTSTSDRQAAADLDAYLASSGNNSLAAAIAANRSLGLAGTDAHATGWENYGVHVWNDVNYLGADVLVEVSTQAF